MTSGGGSADILGEAVRPSVVRIGASGEPGGAAGKFWGSGFFVAPGWVLTAGHVAAAGGEEVWRGAAPVAVTTAEEEVLEGELVFSLPDPDTVRTRAWPFPDLALVRVSAAYPFDPECLWLSDRSTLAPAPGCGLYGWIEVPGGGVEFHPSVGSVSGGRGGHLVVQGGQLRAGCSGGPVVDLERGAVIGVCKGAESTGSVATPITALRTLCDETPAAARVLHEVLGAHDRYHRGRLLVPGECWPRIQPRLQRGDGTFTPELRTALYELFARLPAPRTAGEVLELANEARDMVLRPSYHVREYRPRSWREGAGLLYDAHDGRVPGGAGASGMELEAVVFYAAKVCSALAWEQRGPADALEALAAWVEETGLRVDNPVIAERVADLLAEDPRAASARADVRVVIHPELSQPGTHTWQIELLRPRGHHRVQQVGGRAVARSRLREAICAALPAALDLGDAFTHLAAVEFVVPRQLFDLPVERWEVRTPDGGACQQLGLHRSVVLRDWQRTVGSPDPPEEEVAVREERWQGVSRGPMEAHPLLPERAGRRQPGELSAAVGEFEPLERLAPTAVPLHHAGVSQGAAARAVDAAMDAGYAVALWLREDPSGAPPTGGAQLELVSSLLDESVQAAGLPARVRELRRRGEEGNGTEAACARRLSLLYDPPQRQRRGAGPLGEPRRRGSSGSRTRTGR
ncbi:trypsin-like peptidase domain-containing protein [Streptomyces sulphureus]|uniref:VMAP-C domain-containing protein n=1 Tax=Streptomyces sulphureus TaxID=47758 RepID=UPI000364DD75|nr:trypsin-like peptidase domain-containing protein [Streptomyces sulphureus]